MGMRKFSNPVNLKSQEIVRTKRIKSQIGVELGHDPLQSHPPFQEQQSLRRD